MIMIIILWQVSICELFQLTLGGLQLRSKAVSIERMSMVQVWLDFRKVNLQDELWKVEIISGSNTFQIKQKSSLAVRVSIFITNERDIGLSISIINQYEDLRDFLKLSFFCCSYKKIQCLPDSFFMFALSKAISVQLPFNVPKAIAFGDDSFIFQTNSSQFKLEKQQQIPNKNRFSTPDLFWLKEMFVVPYIPYISNCQFRTNFIIPNYEYLVNKQCYLLPQQQIEPLNPFLFGSKPVADNCTIQYKCIYDQDFSNTNSWFMQPNATVIMKITANAFPAQSQYKVYPPNQQSMQFVDVLVITPDDQQPNNYVPRNVELVLNYYQQAVDKKKILTAFLYLTNYQQAKSKYNYNFSISWRPMSHSLVLIAFGFEWYIYFIAFLIIGFASTIQVIIFSLYHYLTNRKQQRPKIKMGLYFRNFIPNILIGIGLALIPTTIALILIQLISTGKFWDIKIVNFKNKRSVFDYLGNANQTTGNSRTGFGFVVMGFFMLFQSSKYLIGLGQRKQLREDAQFLGNKLTPDRWHKGQFMMTIVVCLQVIFLLIYLSFSQVYSVNVWVFFAVMKILLMILQELNQSYLKETLSKNSLKIVTDTVFYITGLAAPDFYTYLFNFVIDAGTTIVERSYFFKIWSFLVDSISDFLNEIQEKINKLIEGDQQEEQQQVQNKDGPQLLQQFSTEENTTFLIEIQEINYELLECPGPWKESPLQLTLKQRLKDYVKKQKQYNLVEQIEQVDMFEDEQQVQLNQVYDIHCDAMLTIFSNVMNPYVVMMFWWFYDENMVLQNYSISSNSVIFYVLTSIIISIFQMPINFLYIYVMENYLGYDNLNYAEACLERYRTRSVFWKALDDDINQQLQQKARGLDKYCFSSQYFFVLAIFNLGATFIIMGVTTFLNQGYNPFLDVYAPLFMIFWYILSYVGYKLLDSLAYRLNIWDYRSFLTQIRPASQNDSNADLLRQQQNENQNKFSVNLKKVEGYRFKVSKLSNISKKLQFFYDAQAFKLKFIQENKDWILQHLEDIFSEESDPQSLRPLIIKTIICQKGKLRPESGTLQQFQRPIHYKNRVKVFQSVNSSSDMKIFIKEWLARTKDLMSAKAYVNYYIQKNCKQNCQFCGQYIGVRSVMRYNISYLYTSFLAKEGISTISTLQQIYNWQRYFAQRSGLITICLLCSQHLERCDS